MKKVIPTRPFSRMARDIATGNTTRTSSLDWESLPDMHVRRPIDWPLIAAALAYIAGAAAIGGSVGWSIIHILIMAGVL